MGGLRAITLALVVLGSVVYAAGPVAGATGIAPDLRARLDAAVSAFSGDAAVVVDGPRTAFRYAREDDEVLPAASLYKLGVMAEAYRQAAGGLIDLDATVVTVTDGDLEPDGYSTDAGTALSVRELIERMITISDNSSALALLRTLDPHNVNAMYRSLGMPDTRVNTSLPAAEQTADFNTTTARDVETFFRRLLDGTVVGAAQSQEMLGVLERQQINDRLPSGLPGGTTIAHKTGNLDTIAHDAGIVFTPFGPRIVVMLTHDYAQYTDVTTLAAALADAAVSVRAERFAAAVQLAATSVRTAMPGQGVSLSVKVTNVSTFTWTSAVHLAAHWFAGASCVVWDGDRFVMPTLAPGTSTTLTVAAKAPARAGAYTLVLEVVDEGVTWSGDRASIPVVVKARP